MNVDEIISRCFELILDPPSDTASAEEYYRAARDRTATLSACVRVNRQWRRNGQEQMCEIIGVDRENHDGVYAALTDEANAARLRWLCFAHGVWPSHGIVHAGRALQLLSIGGEHDSLTPSAVPRSVRHLILPCTISTVEYLGKWAPVEELRVCHVRRPQPHGFPGEIVPRRWTSLRALVWHVNANSEQADVASILKHAAMLHTLVLGWPAPQLKLLQGLAAPAALRRLDLLDVKEVSYGDFELETIPTQLHELTIAFAAGHDALLATISYSLVLLHLNDWLGGRDHPVSLRQISLRMPQYDEAMTIKPRGEPNWGQRVRDGADKLVETCRRRGIDCTVTTT